MISHKKYMKIAIKLAKKGIGKTSPNPLVGCLIVKRNRIVGKGWHKRYGDLHAEVYALKNAGKRARGATMYVTLEPCSHWGKTPPCTEKIVKAGIREVIIGSRDPNPIVNGYEELKMRGIKTRIGILEEECKKLNEAYMKWIKKKVPFVIVKSAVSLDGKIATKTGDSKYITSMEARSYVHQLRSGVDAVMVGINTVLKDNPQLDVRLARGKNPMKVIVDSKLKLPLRAKVVKKEPDRLIVATTNKASKNKIKKLQQMGAIVLVLKQKKGLVDLKQLMKRLGKLGITSIMIEGGAELNASAIKEGIVDKIVFFISPKMIGNGIGAIGDLGINKVDKSIRLKKVSYREIGKDIVVEGYI